MPFRAAGEVEWGDAPSMGWGLRVMVSGAHTAVFLNMPVPT